MSGYADKGGLVKKLAEEVSEGAADTLDLFERVIDILRPVIDVETEMQCPRVYVSGNYHFKFKQHFGTIPDELPTAGEILSQESRIEMDSSIGREHVVLSHSLEQYLLAVSVLRRNGFNAYPTLAVTSGENNTEQYWPLVALVDLTKEVPLTTFTLGRTHPPMGSIDIISDVAMRGATFTILAEQRAKHLTMELIKQNTEGRKLSEDEVENQLDRIANVLFECHKVWPGTHLIGSALTFLAEDVAEAMVSIQLGEMQQSLEQIAKQDPEMTIPGVLEEQVQETAIMIGERYRQSVLHRLTLKIATSVPHSQ